MELQFYGANCFKISTKKANLVVDDNLSTLGLKSITKEGDISLRSFSGIPEIKAGFNIDMPGEYEMADVVVQGIAARSHIDEEGKSSATIYTIAAGDMRLVMLGHIFSELTEEQIEQIGTVDIVVVPVGDHGYTLDAIDALKLIKKLEPKIVIPSHYADKALKYEVPQLSLEEAIKTLAMEPAEKVAKYKPKTADFTDTTKLVVLERQ